MLSQAEENYIKVIYKLDEGGGNPVPTGNIATAFGIQAPSVTDMIKKLAEKNWVIYEKSKGVKLTPAGRKIAISIVRRHRIWETFLVQTLEFGWDKVHNIAEQLEHVNSDELTNRMDKFLGYPKYDPHGDPIPDKNGKMISTKALLLVQGEVGKIYKLFGIREDSAEFISYLNKMGLGLGSLIEIRSKEAFDQTLQLRINRKSIHSCSSKVAILLNVVAI